MASERYVVPYWHQGIQLTIDSFIVQAFHALADWLFCSQIYHVLFKPPLTAVPDSQNGCSDSDDKYLDRYGHFFSPSFAFTNASYSIGIQHMLTQLQLSQ